MLTLDDFDYPLPPERIAQSPLSERSASRMLVVERNQQTDRRISDLPALITANDLLVFNDTRVIHARLRGRKDSGGQVEVLIERSVGPQEALAQVRASKSPRARSELLLGEDQSIRATVLGRAGEFFHLHFHGPATLETILATHGSLPLPPYIHRIPGAGDEERYQTVYAREPGSVAAPTAGLHFDETLLTTLRERGAKFAWLTLHVGAGTFQPVRNHNLGEHQMHRERYVIPAETVAAIEACRAAGGRVIAVGTTSLRALEGAAQDGPLTAGTGETNLFILPGFRFQIVDALITNFHLPRSTLLMLVSAFAGMQRIRAAYQHAITAEYRFFSYGDAMFLSQREDA